MFGHRAQLDYHASMRTVLLLSIVLFGGVPCQDASDPSAVFLLPYFLGNGEDGISLARSSDGLVFESVRDGKPILPAPDWPGENLTRDPSILYHNGIFHMVWTTGWQTRSFGYASSRDLVTWSEPKKIDIWGERRDIRNTWAPELHWDPERSEYLILWSTTTEDELRDGDGTGNPHGYDHRAYATRTRDFESFTAPELFYSTANPELSVIDPYIAFDPGEPDDSSDDRWVMVIKNEMSEEDGGKNLRLVFAPRMQGPYETRLGPPIVGAGTGIVNTMGEGPSLIRHDGEWRLYWDAPGSAYSYCLATSSDLVHWENRSDELSLPVEHMRHGTVLVVPQSAVASLRSHAGQARTSMPVCPISSDRRHPNLDHGIRPPRRYSPGAKPRRMVFSQMARGSTKCSR